MNDFTLCSSNPEFCSFIDSYGLILTFFIFLLTLGITLFAIFFSDINRY